MTNGKRMEAIEKYVNGVCGEFLAPNRDIKSIECKHRGSMGDTFIKLSDVFGNAYFFDVTNMDMGEIGTMLCKVIACVPTKALVNDREAIREINALFG